MYIFYSGELARRSTPAGITDYHYDKAGRLSTIDDGLSGQYTLAWDGDFRLISIAQPGGGSIDFDYYGECVCEGAVCGCVFVCLWGYLQAL